MLKWINAKAKRNGKILSFGTMDNPEKRRTYFELLFLTIEEESFFNADFLNKESSRVVKIAS